MSRKISILSLCLTCSNILTALDEGIGDLPVRASERLEFSEYFESYFKEDLDLPSSIITQDKEMAPDSKLRITTKFVDKGKWEILFFFPEEVTFTFHSTDQAIYLEFNQTVDSPDLANIYEQMGYLIKRLSNGFNTLYIETKRPVLYRCTADGKTFVLKIEADEQAPLPETKSFKTAIARLFVEERHYKAAECALSDVIQSEPEYKDAQVLLANLEGLLPRWQRSFQILQNLSRQYPFDDDIRTLMNETWCPHASFIEIGRQVQRTVGLAVYQVNSIRGEGIVFQNPSNTLYVGGQYQLYQGHVGLIVNKQGELVGFKGIRNQADLYLRNEWANGSHLLGAIFGQKSAIGGGGEFGFLWPQIQGDVVISAYYHRPYWGVFETLAFYGREDVVLVHIDSVVNRYFSLSGEGGGHRVGIDGTPDGFTSILAAGEVFINFLFPNPIIAFNYGYDAEYIMQQKTKIGINGQPFNPIPYTSFENHSLRAYFYYNWKQRWFVSAFGGETFNRLGLNAPTGGVNVKYVKPCPWGWDLDLSAIRFPSTVVAGATADYYTAVLTIRF